MAETAGAGAAAPDPSVAAVPGWARELLDGGIDPDMVAAAVARANADAAAAEAPPEAEIRAAAALSRREQAQADYEASMTAVQAARDHAATLLESAAAAEEQAAADRDAALEAADELEREG